MQPGSCSLRTIISISRTSLEPTIPVLHVVYPGHSASETARAASEATLSLPLEKSLRDDDRIPWLNDVIEADAKLFLLAADHPHHVDASGRGAIGDAAGKCQRLQHGRVLLLQAGTRPGSSPGRTRRRFRRAARRWCRRRAAARFARRHHFPNRADLRVRPEDRQDLASESPAPTRPPRRGRSRLRRWRSAAWTRPAPRLRRASCFPRADTCRASGPRRR